MHALLYMLDEGDACSPEVIDREAHEGLQAVLKPRLVIPVESRPAEESQSEVKPAQTDPFA